MLGLRPGAWLGARLFAFGAAVAALLAGLGQVAAAPGLREAAFLGALGALLLAGTVVGVVDAAEHAPNGRVRLRADALVMATVVGGLVYLFGRWQGATDELGAECPAHGGRGRPGRGRRRRTGRPARVVPDPSPLCSCV